MYLRLTISMLTFENISKFKIDTGDKFNTRVWQEFIRIPNNKVFLYFKSISVQLLLYNPKFNADFWCINKYKPLLIYTNLNDIQTFTDKLQTYNLHYVH